MNPERCWTCGNTGLHWCLDIERADYMRSPGRLANLRFGPFTFYVNTADNGIIGFVVALRNRSLGWDVKGAE